MFTLGAVGFLHELFVPLSTSTERPTILVLSAALMGLPLFLRAENGHDTRRRNGENGDA